MVREQAHIRYDPPQLTGLDALRSRFRIEIFHTAALAKSVAPQEGMMHVARAPGGLNSEYRHLVSCGTPALAAE